MDIFRFWERRMAADVLVYLLTSPGMCKTELCRELGCERTVFMRIRELIDEGYIRVEENLDPPYNRMNLYLTDEGSVLAEILSQANVAWRRHEYGEF